MQAAHPVEAAPENIALSRTQQAVLGFCAAVAGFGIPVSTAMQNIGTGLLLMCLICMAPLRRELPRVLREPFPIACLLLYAWLCLATSWADVPWANRLEMLERMRIYLVAPVFIAALRNQAARQIVIASFGVAALLSALISLGLGLTGTPWLNTQPTLDNWPVFRSHTYHDLFIAWTVTGLVAALLFDHITKPRHRWLTILVIVVALIDVYFFVRGRSAQALFPLMLVWVGLRWQARKAVLPALLLLFIALPGLYFGSHQIRGGIDRVQENLADYRQNRIDGNSVGLRIEFATNTLKIIDQAPWLGHGTGSFRANYENLTGFTKETNQERASHNPHNDYLWLWSEGGPMAALLLVGVGAAFLFQIQRLPKWQRLTGEAAVLSMLAGTLFNSFFTDNVSGVGFMVLACALLGGPLWPRTRELAPEGEARA
ncbi:MAG: O-antigen ligase family protein [Moraxellaceae bacterium]|nr:O-antigen ligase family protein [Moraxellaceae bacterium]